MLSDGVYGLKIERCTKRSKATSVVAEALAVLRNGTILGSSPLGGTFTGTYTVDSAGRDKVTLHIALAPGAELLNGFRSGSDGAQIDIEAAFERAATIHRAHRAKIEIGGKPMDVTAAFLGPLPD